MLKTILWPTIKLMGRLSYAAKFGLISFLFMVPLVFLSGQVFYGSYQNLKKTEHELSAINNIQQLMNVVEDIELYRNHASPLIFRDDAKLSEKVSKLRVKVEDSLALAFSEIDDDELKEQLKVFKKNHLGKLSIEGDARTPTFNDQFNFFQQVVDQLYLVINKYAQSTGIALDSDPEIQQLMIIILAKSPEVRTAAGFGQAAGIFAMVEKYLQSLTYDLLNDVYEDMASVETSINLIATSLEDLGLEVLAEQAQNSGEGLIDIQVKLDEEVISAVNVVMEWDEFQKFSQPKIKALIELDYTILPLIGKKLQTRLDDQRSHMLMVASVLLTVMVIIIYL